MKTQVCLVLLGLLSASAYAAHMEEMPLPVSNDLNVTAPDQSGAWSFGATAVLMQPTNNTFVYADLIQLPPDGTDGGGNANIYSVREGYYGWFGADVSYAFPGNSRDVILAYEGLRGDTSASVSPPSVIDGKGILYSSFTGASYATAQAETKTAYDAGDLVFGQKLKVGTRIGLHPFVGLRYAHIDVKNSGDYTSLADEPPLRSENSELENTFSGIGPRFGSDAQINLGQGFSVRARLGLSALIGSHIVDESAILAGIDSPTNPTGAPLPYTINTPSEINVIPEIDGRLGLNYTYDFNSKVALGIEAGWQVTNYFNVITGPYSPETTSKMMDGISKLDTSAPTANFGMQGPYARLQLDIA